MVLVSFYSQDAKVPSLEMQARCGDPLAGAVKVCYYPTAPLRKIPKDREHGRSAAKEHVAVIHEAGDHPGT